MALIIGSEADPHVKAVLARVRAPAVVVDAASLAHAPVTLTADAVTVSGQKVADRGWIRRLAPEGWAESLSGTDLKAAERTASISALAAIVRNEEVEWLTPLDAFGAAENKPLQYRRAAQVGVPVPEWVVTTDPDSLPTRGEWVSKPMGRGSFIDDQGTGWVVPTAVVDLTKRSHEIVRVPFILQRHIQAKAHARVVTVGRPPHCTVQSATLSASGLPLDWRLNEAGHTGFTTTPAPAEVHDLAAKATAVLGVGFSAQDWICDQYGVWWFVDLNPAGQWLFLPSEVADAVTTCIATFLDGSQAPNGDGSRPAPCEERS